MFNVNGNWQWVNVKENNKYKYFPLYMEEVIVKFIKPFFGLEYGVCQWDDENWITCGRIVPKEWVEAWTNISRIN